MRQPVAFLLTVVFVGSTAFTATFGDVTPQTQINGNWLIDVRTICAVGMVVLGGTWWVARWMQKVESRLSAAEIHLAVVELAASKREEMLTDIQMKVHHIASGDIKHSKGHEIR